MSSDDFSIPDGSVAQNVCEAPPLAGLDAQTPSRRASDAIGRLMRALSAPESRLHSGFVIANSAQLLMPLVSAYPGTPGADIVAELHALGAPAPMDAARMELELRLTNCPAWYLVGTVHAVEEPCVLELVAAELLLSLALDRPFRRSALALVAGLRTVALQDRKDHEKAIENYTRRLKREVEQVLSSGTREEIQQLSVAARLTSSVAAQMDPADLSARKGVDGTRSCSPTAFRAAAVLLVERVVAGDDEAILTMLASQIPFSPVLLNHVPLLHPELKHWTAAVDLAQGVILVDLSALHGGSSRSVAGHVPATPLLQVPMPEILHEALIGRLAIRRHARTLGELLDHDHPSRVAVPVTPELTISLTQFWSGRQQAALACGLKAADAAVTVGALGLPGAVKPAHYYAIDFTEVLRFAGTFFEWAGWGAVSTAAIQRKGVAIGSPAVLSTDALKSAHQTLYANAKKKPGNKYTLNRLLDFHAHFATYTAHVLCTQLLARRAHVLKISATCARGGLAFLDDKRRGPFSSLTPLPVPEESARQIEFWLAHLRAMRRRLEKCNAMNDALSKRFAAVESARDVGLIFSLAMVGQVVQIKEIGTEALTADSAALRADGAGRRDAMINLLRQEGLPTKILDTAMRHHVHGISPWMATGSVPHFEYLQSLSLAISRVCIRLGIHPLAGLSAR